MENEISFLSKFSFRNMHDETGKERSMFQTHKYFSLAYEQYNLNKM